MGVPAGPWHVDDTLTFTVVTHRVDTGALTDADSVPTYRIYEDETGTAILNGSTAKLDDANTTGFYSEQITLSAANGFENGKSYSIYVSAAVNSVTGGQTFNFKVDVPDVNVTHAAGTAWASGAITAASIAPDAIGASELAADAATEIGTAVWATAARTLTALDEDSTTLDLDATIRAAVGLATANLDTQIGDLPTNAELTAALASADDAVLAEVALVKAKTDNLPSDPADQSIIIAATDAILSAVGDVPTNAELATALGTADDAVLAQIALVKAKTDSLTFTVAGVLDANIQYVNDTAVTGDGSAGTPWGP
jgi:hypothetical protein